MHIDAASNVPNNAARSEPDRVEHRPHVIHPRLERGRLPHAVREAGAAPVEQDQPREAQKPLVERLVVGLLRLDLEIAREPVDEEEVALTVADDPVCDADVAAAGIPDVERVGRHTLQLWPRRRPNGSCSSRGEWVETGDWIEVRSPYSGDVVGRVAKGGADETRRAIDAAERALARAAPGPQARRDPRPGRRLPRPPARGGRAHDLRRGGQADEGRARRGGARDVDVHVRRSRGAHARRRDGPDGRRRRPARASSRFTLRVPIGIVGAISPFNFPLNLVAHKIAPALAAGCAVVLKPATQTPLSALLLAELEEEAGLPPGLAERRRRPRLGDRRRPRRGRAREADHVHRLRRRRLGHPRARAAQEGQPRARQRDAGDRRRERRPRRRDLEGSPRTRSRSRARAASRSSASTSSATRTTTSSRSFVPKVEALKVGDPADEDTDVGPVIDEDARDRAARVDRRGAPAWRAILTGGELDGDGCSGRR